MSGPRLQIDAPQELYTMPEERVMHWISDEQLATLDSGGRDQFFDYFLAAVCVAIGFVQNLFNLYNGLTSNPQDVESWDVIASILCVAAFAVSGAFFLASNRKHDPVKRVIADIRKRQTKRFDLSSTPVQSKTKITIPNPVHRV